MTKNKNKKLNLNKSSKPSFSPLNLVLKDFLDKIKKKLFYSDINLSKKITKQIKDIKIS